MPKPPINTTGAENNITPDMNAELESIINDTPAVQTAESTNTAATDTAKTESADSAKIKREYTSQSLATIGKINQRQRQNNDKYNGTAMQAAMQQFRKSIRICGYITPSDAKIDFKKTIIAPSDTAASGGVAKAVFGLAQYAPTKPNRVILKYPMDTYSKLKAGRDTITTQDMAELKKLESSESAYGVQIFRVDKNDMSLYNFVNTTCDKPVIIEDESIFTEFVSISPSGKVTRKNSYRNSEFYKETDGVPGLSIDTIVKAKDKGSTVGNKTLINIVGAEASELVIRYKHSGRPRWVAPGNYIAEKRWVTDIGHAVEDTAEQNALSLAYFKRYFEADMKTPKLSKTQLEKGWTAVTSGNITFSGETEESFIASCFADPKFWAEASVQHWYDVVTVNGNTEKRVLRGNELAIVKRVAKVSSKGVTSYVNSYITLQDVNGAGGYTFDMIPTPIKNALGSALSDFTFDKYQASCAKTSSTGSKTSATIHLNFQGLTFEQVREIYEDVLLNGGSTDKFA